MKLTKGDGVPPSLVDEGEISKFLDAHGVKNSSTHAKKIVDSVFRAERKLLRCLSKESGNLSEESTTGRLHEPHIESEAKGGASEGMGVARESSIRVSDFNIRNVKNLPPKVYDLLSNAPVLRTKVILANGSSDSVTTKLLIKVPSG